MVERFLKSDGLPGGWLLIVRPIALSCEQAASGELKYLRRA